MHLTQRITERSYDIATFSFALIGTMFEQASANITHADFTSILADLSYAVAIVLGALQIWRMFRKRRITKAEAREVLFPKEKKKGQKP